MDFESWLLQIGKSKRSAQSYSGAVSGVISKWANQAGLINVNLTAIDSIKVFAQLSNEIRKLEVFAERDSKGNRMYSVALKHYAAFMEDVYQENLIEDIDLILDDSELAKTEKNQLISARLGQGKFRNSQIKSWQCCALTGYTDTRFLIASHIKPWRYANNTERLDRYNGLLLLPNIDKVFDLGFISFKAEGSIIISNSLDNPKILGLSNELKLDLKEQHLGYMSYHRDMIFERNI